MYLYDLLGHRKEKPVTSGAWVTTTQFVLAGTGEIADYNGVGGLPVMTVTRAVDGATLTAAYRSFLSNCAASTRIGALPR
jgi:hypothetical protein